MTTHDKRTNGAYFNHSAHNVRMPGTGSPPSAVTTRQATREELDELSRKLGSLGITRDQYLDARLAGESRRAIAERHGYTVAGLAGAVNRWGLLEAGAEQQAMRERAGVTLPPDVRTTREDGAGSAQTSEVVQVVSQDEIDTSERLSDAHAITQEEREIMFAGDASQWGSNDHKEADKPILTYHQQMVALSLQTLAADIHQTAREHGWHDDPVAFPVQIALIHSELSEALEADRKHKGRDAVEEELADVLIRLLDTSMAHGYDLPGAVLRKAEANKARPHRHGGLAY